MRVLRIVLAIAVAALLVVALLGPVLLDAQCLAIDLPHDLAPPSAVGGLGRSENGVDVWCGLVFGARTSLVVGLCTTVACLVTGTLLGASAALVGGRVDAALQRVIDVVMAFPSILLAMYLAALLPPSRWHVVLALSVTGWVTFARIARAGVLVLTAGDRLVAARALGASPTRVLLTHVLPALAPALVAQASFTLSSSILAEGALAFVGIGTVPGTPSWGALLDEGTAHLLDAPHIAVAAGLSLAAAVVVFQALGEALGARR